ncbi:MAG: glycosyltransferase [Chloroflexi bacterium]|nr:glycosyltransferase [Chloroflexota bacterium]
MTAHVAHVVRRWGGITEPFIEQRVRAAGAAGELWYERSEAPPPTPSRLIDGGWIKAGSTGDRLFHRIPTLAALSAGAYRSAEVASRPDVIHAHYLTTGYVVGRATSRPLVISTYGFDVTLMPQRPLWRRPIANLTNRCSLVLAEGPAMKSRLIALGFKEEQARIVPIAAGLQDIVYHSPVIPTGPIQYLICGRMVAKKGHDLAIAAFAEAAPRLPDGSTLTIVGDGPLAVPIRGLVQRLGLEQRISFTGALPRRDYLAVLRQSHVLLAPSRTAPDGDGEGGAPTTILDAQASGVIVIGSRHADIPFLVDEGVTGFLADEGRADALGEAMLRALDGAPWWPTIASRARRQVEERHSDEAVARALAAIHIEAAGG